MIAYKIILIFLLTFFSTTQANTPKWLSSVEMTDMYEAFIKISSTDIYNSNQTKFVQSMLKNYIRSFDLYGDYFTKEEYKAFEKTLTANYSGVGMILYQQKRNDKILCIPTNKRLKKYGIDKYDELIRVNNKKVEGVNFYLVSSWIRGRTGSSVNLTIKKTSGKIKIITLKRSKQSFKSINRNIHDGIVILKIIRFTNETSRELRKILSQWSKDIPLIIDLRGNGGGDLFEAIKSADLFLPKKTLITSIKTKQQIISYYAKEGDKVHNKKVILLQDKFTASAAEVFIAALTQNNRAQSIGTVTFGKGVAQRFTFLNNGDAMLLTYGRIITPNKISYDRKGLLPTSTKMLRDLVKK